MKLPSRGTVMVEGMLNDSRFRAALEPDGQGSHWVRVDKQMCEAAQVKAGDIVTLQIKPSKTWPEPNVPTDITRALKSDPEAQALWADVTPMARWDWIHWVDAVKLAETRKQRPEKLVAMLKSGKRRPCCFNRAIFTIPKVAELL